MAKVISEEIQSNVRDLIAKITHFEVGSEKFTNIEKCVLTTLKKSDSMYFLNTKDIKRQVWSMSEKFMFHGFFKHADYLKQCHDKYIDRNLSESDLTPRLNVVKFLLCMSQQPTNQFWKDPDKFEFINESEEQQQVEDWGAYLNEGIERWSPTKDESYQESDSEHETEEKIAPKEAPTRIFIPESKKAEPYDFRACRQELLDCVQNGWYNCETVVMKPPSNWFDANVGILWQQHLESEVKGLVEVDPICVISEYKVMREVLWQMWGPHRSTVFELVNNKLVPRSNVTVASVRAMTFEEFLGVFMPYIEVLNDFRQFYQRLESEGVCETYRNYCGAVQTIMKPVFLKLVALEKEIRDQETTMTLLKLAEKFEEIFEPVFVLKNIHNGVIFEDFEKKTPLECALGLLTQLRSNLQFSVNKLEQDIRLTLYLESLFYYLSMINAWFLKNDLFDPNKEFVILNNSERFKIDFRLQDFSSDDRIIKIITEEVLEIGRNIHLLRLLRKYDVFSKETETIHQSFVQGVLEELAHFYDYQLPQPKEKVTRIRKIESTFDVNQMGDWTNFVDMSDGFLVKAFEEFHYEEVSEDVEATLFEKIANITTNIFPLQNLPEKVFSKILKDRFTISGLMVKNLLIDNYNLDKQFDFLNHVFLFWDDLIFPFYRRFFEKMNTANSKWGNSVWLTSHLQDIIMDLYPNFYEDCTVQVKDLWKQCRDSLEACTLISIQYEIKWPLSIIITDQQMAMYKEIFEFILKIKWALYSINHMFFVDLFPKTKPQHPRSIKRLKWLRFGLINILNAIQHYLFGYVFTKSKIQFELDFEKSHDLKSLISSQEDFIKSIYRSAVEIRDKKRNQSGFQTLLKCVKMLKVMWNDLDYAGKENLDKCQQMYREAYDVIDGIVNPVFFN